MLLFPLLIPRTASDEASAEHQGLEPTRHSSHCSLNRPQEGAKGNEPTAREAGAGRLLWILTERPHLMPHLMLGPGSGGGSPGDPVRECCCHIRRICPVSLPASPPNPVLPSMGNTGLLGGQFPGTLGCFCPKQTALLCLQRKENGGLVGTRPRASLQEEEGS